MSDITRKQYDNAVRIKNDGYSCRLQSPGCLGCPLQVVECGRSGEQEEGHDIRISAIDFAISTYEAAHPEEFRKPPRIYDYRDVDLPEVQALIGKDVYASDYLIHFADSNLSVSDIHKLNGLAGSDACPFATDRNNYQFIRAIDEPPKIKLTRAELIAIAAKSSGVKPEQIVVEE